MNEKDYNRYGLNLMNGAGWALVAAMRKGLNARLTDILRRDIGQFSVLFIKTG